MQFTPRETAHILAALRTCQQRGVIDDWHFDETEPLSDAEVDILCQRINEAGPDVELGKKADGESGGGLHGASGRSPSGAPDEKPCGRRKAAPTQEEERGPNRAYTVVGLYPDSEWDSSMRDGSFVEHVHAQTPSDAAEQARRQMARTHLSNPGTATDATPEQEVTAFAANIEILALFHGFLDDVYDPQPQEPGQPAQ